MIYMSLIDVKIFIFWGLMRKRGKAKIQRGKRKANMFKKAIKYEQMFVESALVSDRGEIEVSSYS